MSETLITNDAVVLGILLALIAMVMTAAKSENPIFTTLFKIAPPLLFLYFLPSLLTSFHIVSPKESKLYFMASRYLLPTCLVLITLSFDWKGILRLGPKALVMFLIGTVSVIIGGPLALFITSLINPDLVAGEGADALWRGLAGLAGTWIGGGANMMAMKQVFQPSEAIFGAVVCADVFVAGFIWMSSLFIMARNQTSLDKWLNADTRDLDEVKKHFEQNHNKHDHIASATDIIKILGVGFGTTGIAHFFADMIGPFVTEHFPEFAKSGFDSTFLWVVFIASAIGIAVSFTSISKLEHAGASRIGTAMIYLLVATIGLEMDLGAVFKCPGIFVVALIWMSFHAAVMFAAAKYFRAPIFYMAVGSEANIGGAASAPVVAAAFHPALAPVGVLLAIFGYALGTYGGWLCGLLMEMVSK